ncbi:hypothetical protein WME91_47845 [Sorangium sp. So ce269]
MTERNARRGASEEEGRRSPVLTAPRWTSEPPRDAARGDTEENAYLDPRRYGSRLKK